MADSFRPDGPTPGWRPASLTKGQEELLEAYRIELSREPVTPRKWVRKHPSVEPTAAYREMLWSYYRIVYPPPKIPGFDVLDVLGQGGMGRVYLGQDVSLKRLAAVKEMTDQMRYDPEWAERFRLEAQILAKLNHQNIVTVYRLFRHEGREFIAMEYVDHGDLSDRLEATGPLRIESICSILAAVARGVDYLHTQKIIHRDLKLSNILFDGSGRPKISDFGLAKDLRDPTDRTKGAIFGTPQYMAPEQVNCEPAVPGTDIWALGVTLFRLLTGRFPFGERESQLFDSIRRDPPAPFGDEVPQSLQEICLKCLEKDPSRRYASGNDLAAALDASAKLMPKSWSLPRFSRRAMSRVGLGILASVVAGVTLPRIVNGIGGDGAGKMIESHAFPCRAVAFTADGETGISESGGALVHLWNLKEKTRIATIEYGLGTPDPAHSGALTASNSGYVAALGINVGTSRLQGLNLLELVELGERRTRFLSGGTSFARSMAFSSDESCLILIAEPTIRTSSDQDGGFVRETTEAAKGFFERAGIRVKTELTTIELASRKRGESFPMAAEATCLAVDPAGNDLVVVGHPNQSTLRLLNFKTGNMVREIAAGGGCDWLAYSADGSEIYAGCIADDSIRIISAVQGSDKTRLIRTKPSGKMTCASFWAGGRASTGHADGNVVVWNLKDGTSQVVHRDKNPPTAVALSPDGTQFLAAFSDGSLRHARI